MRVALVYDRVNKWGGAERVLLALHEIWPEAPLFTSVYNFPTATWAKNFKVIPSFLQKFPGAKMSHELFAPLMPFVFESFNFDEFEVVISVASEAGKGIITKPKTLHLCYCLTPTRYLWSGYKEYFEKEWKRYQARYLVAYLRMWDKIAANRPDEYIAISKTVQARIKNYYHRESKVIYPPVEIEKFQIPIRQPADKFQMVRQAHHPEQGRGTNTKCFALRSKIQPFDFAQGKNTKYFLVVSRLVKYKKVDLVIEAFNQLRWSLKIVGVGREMGDLRDKARENIEFLGQLTDEQLLAYYQSCQAVICPQEEDFGIVALEAQACGKPVIAYRGGGVTETVNEGETGEFFGKQTVESLAAKLQSFKAVEYKAEDCRKQAERYSKKRFKKEFKKFVEEKWQRHLKNISMS